MAIISSNLRSGNTVSFSPFYFSANSNTPGGAKSSGAIYSLIQTATENGLNSQAYLEYVFKQIQQRNSSDIGKMLPWSEETPESCKLLVNRS